MNDRDINPLMQAFRCRTCGYYIASPAEFQGQFLNPRIADSAADELTEAQVTRARLFIEHSIHAEIADYEVIT